MVAYDTWTRVLQVTNLAPGIAVEQLRTLFSFVGKLDEIVVYPSSTETPCITKVAYVKFTHHEDCECALLLSNTVVVEKAMVIHPVKDIPKESEGILLSAPANAVGGMFPRQKNWPPDVVNYLVGAGTQQAIVTIDPKLKKLGLPDYPPLSTASTDATRLEDIRRTVYLSNLHPDVTCVEIETFMGQVGEIRYIRMAGRIPAVGSAIALVEYQDQCSVAPALALSNICFKGQSIKVAHSLHPIQVPNRGEVDMLSEMDQALKVVQNAQALISASVNQTLGSTREKSRSRSRRRRSRSRSHSRRKRSHRSSRRSHSRSRKRHRRSRSHHRSRSRHRTREDKSSKSRHRSRSRDRRESHKTDHHRRSSKDRHRRHKSPRKDHKSPKSSPPKSSPPHLSNGNGKTSPTNGTRERTLSSSSSSQAVPSPPQPTQASC